MNYPLLIVAYMNIIQMVHTNMGNMIFQTDLLIKLVHGYIWNALLNKFNVEVSIPLFKQIRF